MQKEKSCGAVIYRVKNGDIFYLLSKMSLGHTSLTKGHVENGETEVETAKREILEETSLKPLIDTGFRKVITYVPFAGKLKDVVFFVAKDDSDASPIDQHDSEVCSFEWVTFDEAYQKLTHDSDKEVLKDANNYIKDKENGKF